MMRAIGLMVVACVALAGAAYADEPVLPPAEIPLDDVGFLRVAHPLLAKQLLIARFESMQAVTANEIEKRDAELAAAIARVAADAGGGTAAYALDVESRRLVLVPTTSTTSTSVSSTTTTSSTTTSTVPDGG